MLLALAFAVCIALNKERIPLRHMKVSQLAVKPLIAPPPGCDAVQNFNGTLFTSAGTNFIDGPVFQLTGSSSSALVTGFSLLTQQAGSTVANLWDISTSTVLASLNITMSSGNVFQNFFFPSPVIVVQGKSYVLGVWYQPVGLAFYRPTGPAFPAVSSSGMFTITGNSNCQGSNPSCFPTTPDTTSVINSFSPIVCPGSSTSCPSFASCDSCTSNSGCLWCEDSLPAACQASNQHCRSQITSPNYCPAVNCATLVDCVDCASSSTCIWCLSSKICEFYSNVTCLNRVGNPTLCQSLN